MQEKPYRLPDGRGLYRRIVGNDLLNTKKKGEKLSFRSLFSLYLRQIALSHFADLAESILVLPVSFAYFKIHLFV